MSKKIVVVGSLNLDLVASVPRMPAEGETLTGTDFATYPGGKGANQAVAAARLGADVAMVGRLGNDNFAVQLREGLHSDNVNTDCVLSVNGPSGSAVIMVTPQGSNSIVVIPGANAALTPQDLDQHEALFRQAGIVLAQLETPLETIAQAGKIAAGLGVPFLLDPAPAQALPKEIFRNVTWLTPNETETRILLGHLGFSMDEESIDDDVAAAAVEHLLSTGVRNVILKLGSRGVFLSGKDVPAVRLEPFKVRAVDTTAAGDAFNGAFAYALIEGNSPVNAARFACAAAAVSVTRVGAQPSMPVLDEVKSLMDRATDTAPILAK